MILINLDNKKEYFIPLKKTTGEELHICPECSENRKKKSVKCFSYNHDKNVGHCNHCGITLLIKKEFEVKKEYKKPEKWKNKTNLSEKLIKWFEDTRGINQSTVNYFKITEGAEFMPQINKTTNTIQFNYFRGEELINIKYRDAKKNFKLFKDAELIFYNLNSIKESEDVIICEGEIDAMSIHQSGFKHVISVPNGAGTGKINLDYLDNCIEYFSNKTKIYLATDNDLAGRNLQEQLSERLGKERCYKVKFKDCKDANECLVKYGIQGVIESIADKIEFPLVGISTVEDYSYEINDLYDNGLSQGAKTNMANLNKLLTFHKGYITTITGVPNMGKALCIDTDIPTVSGWKKMGDISVGDVLFDEKGNQTTVLAVTDVMINRPCYKIIFNDGSFVIADEQHKWLTDTWKSRRSAANKKKNNLRDKTTVKNNGSDQSHKRTFPSVKTTLEISQTVVTKKDNRNNHSIPLTLPINCSEEILEIPPYTLGAWLGDGTSTGSGFTSNDIEIIREIEKDGLVIKKWGSKYSYGIMGLTKKLTQLKIINNKHIPTKYLRSSVEQRMSLLQGLMDTDGYIDKVSGVCEFCNTNKILSHQTYELITSLGIRATIREYDAKLYGKYISKKYRIQFTTKINVFRLERKLVGLPLHRRSSKNERYIVSCQKTDSVPVKCIKVDSESHLFLCTKSFIATHNSDALDQITLGLSLTSDWKGGFYSPENKPTSLHISKLARKLIGKDWWGDGRMNKDEIEMAKNYLNDRFFFIKPETDFTLDTILKHVKGLILRKGIDFFVIDAWNKLEHKFSGDEHKYIGECLDKLSVFCEINKVHLFLVAHPRKMLKQRNSNKYEVPNLYDISGSANFFNKSDNGICIYRDYEENTSYWYVQKVKFSHWGSTGYCEFKYDMECGRYNEYLGGETIYNKTPWIHSVKTGYSEDIKQQAANHGIILNDGLDIPF